MSFPKFVGLASGEEKKTSSVQTDKSLGVRAWTDDGRIFRWAKNSSVALEGAKTVQAPAVNSSQDAALAIPAAISSGGHTVNIVVQAAVTRDQYKDGWVTIDTPPGTGMYKIASHPAASSGETLAVTLASNDPLRDALSTVTKVGLRPNPFADVIVTPTTVTGAILGMTPTAIPASQYFWLQEGDFGMAHTDVAPAVNTSLMFGGTSAGNLNARSSALNDVPEIDVAQSVDAGAGADKDNFVRITLA